MNKKVLLISLISLILLVTGIYFLIQKINRESILTKNIEIENTIKEQKCNVPEEKYLQLFDNYVSIQEYEKSFETLKLYVECFRKNYVNKDEKYKNLLLKTGTMYEDRANYLKNKNDFDNANKKNKLAKGVFDSLLKNFSGSTILSDNERKVLETKVMNLK
ncbi:MAG: hypothetical protein PHF46_04835 [Candidatus Gracilibacteria bacterium]|nr:hypothetical protein [Candidatus Gracilibacteria bacterium]